MTAQEELDRGLAVNFMGTIILAAGTKPAPPFVPTQIPGLKLWLRADQGVFQDAALTTPAVLDGDLVGGWADQSGQGNNVTQTVAGNKGVLKLAVQNGKPVVRFNGVSQFLTSAAPVTAVVDNWSMFCVCRRSAGSQQLAFYNGSNVPAANGYGLSPYGNTGKVAVLYGGISWGDTTTAADALWHDLEALRVSGVLTVYRDGVPLSPTFTAGPTAPTVATYVGVDGGSGTSFFQGDIGELLLWAAALTPAQQGQVEASLRSRWATP